jgi:hypothetical protein
MRERFAQAYPTSFRRWEAARADEECDLPYAGSFGGSEDSPFESALGASGWSIDR